MPSPYSATITFRDVDEPDECLAIVRRSGAHVVLALSRSEDGDIQVVMGLDDARKVLEALNAAIAAV